MNTVFQCPCIAGATFMALELTWLGQQKNEWRTDTETQIYRKAGCGWVIHSDGNTPAVAQNSEQLFYTSVWKRLTYCLQPKEEANLVHLVGGFMGNHVQAVNIWEEEAVADTFCPLSTSALGPGEGLAIALRLTQVGLWHPKSLGHMAVLMTVLITSAPPSLTPSPPFFLKCPSAI